MFRPCPQCGDFYVREKGLCKRCAGGARTTDVDAAVKAAEEYVWQNRDRFRYSEDADFDRVREIREERRQREADRADFARHE